MTTDIDALLLDRLYQPVADRAADWISCFGLARASLGAAVLLQVAGLIFDLSSDGDAVSRAVAGGVTVLGLIGARQAWALVERTERQAQPGSVNLRRITLRWQRLAWLAVTSFAVATGLASDDGGGMAICGASLAWVSLVYFVSCTPAPPRRRTMPRQVFA